MEVGKSVRRVDAFDKATAHSSSLSRSGRCTSAAEPPQRVR